MMPPKPPKKLPSAQTTLPSLAVLLVSAALLIASLVMPMIIMENTHWMSGPTLIQFGAPHLLFGEASDGVQTYFVIMASLAVVTAAGLLLGAARLLGKGLATTLAIVATLGLLSSLVLSLVLLVGAAAESATAGVAAYGLPAGFFGALLAGFVPGIRDGWIRRPRGTEATPQA